MRSIVSVILISLWLTACSAAPQPGIAVTPPGAGLRLYLQPLPQEAHRITLTLAGMTALMADGSSVELLREAMVLQANDLIGVQKKLFTGNLPSGRYLGVSLRIEKATLLTDEGETALLVPAEALVASEEFRIEPDQTLALFLSLAPERLVTDGFRLTPTFSLWQPRPALPGLKGLASNAAAGTLSLFEKKTPSVVAVIAAGAKPQGLVLDQPKRWAYVALSDENAIAALDLSNEKIQDKVRLRSGDAPQELALSPDGQTLVAANIRSNSISIMNTAPLAERGRILLTTAPASVFFGTANDRAYLVQPETNTLAIIDLNRRQLLGSVNLEDEPVRGAASSDGRSLYVLTANSPNLLILDSATLAVTERVFVGFGALSLVVNPSNDLVYVGRKSGEIAVIDPSVNIPIDSLRIEGDVADLALDREENTLFAASKQLGRITKYDLIGKKLLGLLEVDAGTYGLVVMGEK